MKLKAFCQFDELLALAQNINGEKINIAYYLTNNQNQFSHFLTFLSLLIVDTITGLRATIRNHYCVCCLKRV